MKFEYTNFVNVIEIRRRLRKEFTLDIPVGSLGLLFYVESLLHSLRLCIWLIRLVLRSAVCYPLVGASRCVTSLCVSFALTCVVSVSLKASNVRGSHSGFTLLTCSAVFILSLQYSCSMLVGASYFGHSLFIKYTYIIVITHWCLYSVCLLFDITIVAYSAINVHSIFSADRCVDVLGGSFGNPSEKLDHFQFTC